MDLTEVKCCYCKKEYTQAELDDLECQILNATDDDKSVLVGVIVKLFARLKEEHKEYGST